MSPSYEVTLADIEAARQRIGTLVRRTPLTTSATLSARLGCHVYLKLELFQTTGSFKSRGSLNKALALGLAKGDRVVAVSGGNHAQGVAWAARTLGLRATILMPQNTPVNYLNATMDYGAEVVLVSNIAEGFEILGKWESDGAVVIHPFDDPFVIAGTGTCGLEIIEDLPEITDIVVSIGGGGFIAGVATALKSKKPSVRVWGVETVGADAMAQALAAGHPVQLPAITSIAKTLGAPAVSESTLAFTQRYVESVTVVPDSEAVAAIKVLLERAKVLAEPASSCTWAAAQRLKSNFTPESHVVLIICGGNVSIGDLHQYTA